PGAPGGAGDRQGAYTRKAGFGRSDPRYAAIHLPGGPLHRSEDHCGADLRRGRAGSSTSGHANKTSLAHSGSHRPDTSAFAGHARTTTGAAAKATADAGTASSGATGYSAAQQAAESC
ncbi:MAG TPA: hypothetical protein VJ417_13590, partial [Candidatus Glassbacteria bacterium]|nr:hypothetical protein [Candidatus Glassbacteria bacterium]